MAAGISVALGGRSWSRDGPGELSLVGCGGLDLLRFGMGGCMEVIPGDVPTITVQEWRGVPGRSETLGRGG